jgi:hypothetical protein
MDVNPTTANTTLTTHSMLRLDPSKAKIVSGIQSAEGIRMAANRILNTPKEKRWKTRVVAGSSLKRRKDVKAKKPAAPSSMPAV